MAVDTETTIPTINRIMIDVVSRKPMTNKRQREYANKLMDYALHEIATDDDLIVTQGIKQMAWTHTHDATSQSGCGECTVASHDERSGGTIVDA